METFGKALGTWRKARRLSQLGLAGEAGVSSRHIAFLETGRARPSPDMVERLGAALALPLAARNRLLGLAGFAPRHGPRLWSDAEMAPVHAAVTHMLERHAPYPALALDRLWSVLRLNGPARALFAPFGAGEGTSLLALMTSGALRPAIENWPEVARHAALRLRTESAAQGGAPELEAAAARLWEEAGPGAPEAGPVSPVVLRARPARPRLSLFAVIAQFGAPTDALIEDVRIEFYFPADAETEAALRGGERPLSPRS